MLLWCDASNGENKNQLKIIQELHSPLISIHISPLKKRENTVLWQPLLSKNNFPTSAKQGHTPRKGAVTKAFI